MAEAEDSFKVCGLCSQLVDEAVKLTDELLEFLVVFLGVSGAVLPTKICTECYQGAIDSRKFKEKCLRTVDKLNKTQISSNMILGRSQVDIKAMKNKYKQIRKSIASVPNGAGSKEEKVGFSSAPIYTPPRRQSRTSSDNSGVGSEDLPLSTRHSLRKKAIKRAAGDNEEKRIPTVILSPKDRNAAETVLRRTSSFGRSLKRKIHSPSRFDASHSVKRKPKVDQSRSEHKPSHAAGVVEIEDEEEIFPSVGPYQCEICQDITQTKQEFVKHIKSLHKDMVDEQVLRSLETDLKKRMKKELNKKETNPDKTVTPVAKAVSKVVSKGGGKPAPGPSLPEKQETPKNRSSRPNPRPRPKYTIDEDDDYKPSSRKKRTPGKADGGSAQIYKKGPGKCEICGQVLSQARDLPKHQESLKCKQVAFKKSQLGAVLDEVSVDLTKSKSELGAEGRTEIEQSQDGEIKEKSDKTTSDLINQSEGNSNDSESNGQKLNGLDAKFKASIAKRYEAERGSGEEKLFDETEGAEEAVERSDIDETELAIRKAMQESLETAEQESVLVSKQDSQSQSKNKDQEQGYNNVQDQPDKEQEGRIENIFSRSSYEINHQDTHLREGSYSKEAHTVEDDHPLDARTGQGGHHHGELTSEGGPLQEENRRDKLNPRVEGGTEHLEEEPVGEHSPASYIDPTPQPDIEPSHKPSSCNLVQNMSNPHSSESLTAQNNFVKPWESGSSSTLDISALTSQDQDQPQDQALDSLESQMAALHGAAGANTPWHSFQSDYY